MNRSQLLSIVTAFLFFGFSILAEALADALLIQIAMAYRTPRSSGR
jgi:hypothetical protein